QLRGRPRYVFCNSRSAHYRTDSVWGLNGCGRTDHAIDDTKPIRRTFNHRNYRMGWSRTDSDLRCRATTITITAYDCGHCFFPCGNANIFCFPATRGLEIIACCPHCRFDVGAVVGSVSTFVALQTDMLQNLGIWFAGSFTGVTRGRYELLWIVAAMTVVVYFIADRYTVAGL